MPAFNTTSRIAFGGTDIDYAVLKDSVQNDDFDHVIHTDKAGGVVVYPRVTQQEWTDDIICTEAEANTTIRAWMQNRSTVVYTPDLVGAPGTTKNIIIMNPAFPFRHWGSGKWRGSLRMRETS